MDSERYEEFMSRNEEGYYVCNLCHDFKRTTKFPLKRHINQAHLNHEVTFKGNASWPERNIVLCKQLCAKLAHFHCFHCTKIFISKERFISHLETLLKKGSTENPETQSLPTGSNNSDEYKKEEDSKCLKKIKM